MRGLKNTICVKTWEETKIIEIKKDQSFSIEIELEERIIRITPGERPGELLTIRDVSGTGESLIIKPEASNSIKVVCE